METNQKYPSDMTDAEWAVLEALLPPEPKRGRRRKYAHRAMLNAIFYVLRSGCAWRMLPLEYPKWQAVYAYLRLLERNGTAQRILDELRRQERERQGRSAEPTTLVVDSQSVKTTEKGGSAAGTDTSTSRDASAFFWSIP
jgi:putative transposase